MINLDSWMLEPIHCEIAPEMTALKTQLGSFQSEQCSSRLIHPNAPCGGCGPGASQLPGPLSGLSNKALPHAAAPALRSADWTAVLASVKNPYRIQSELQARIRSARSLEELLQVAAALATARSTLEKQGLIRKPESGDKAVKEAVKSAVSDFAQLGFLRDLVFSSAWELADEGIGAAIVAGAKQAMWEAFDHLIKEKAGAVTSEIVKLCKEGDLKGVVKIFKAAIEALQESLLDREGFVKRTLDIMERNGVIVDKATKYRLKRFLSAKLDAVARGFASIPKLLVRSIIAFDIFFTHSRIVDGPGELYYAFDVLREQLETRSREFWPEAMKNTSFDRLRKETNGPLLRGSP